MRHSQTFGPQTAEQSEITVDTHQSSIGCEDQRVFGIICKRQEQSGEMEFRDQY